MKQVTTIGLDIAKSVFLVHGVDPAGQAVLPEAGCWSSLPNSRDIEACASPEVDQKQKNREKFSSARSFAFFRRLFTRPASGGLFRSELWTLGERALAF